MSTRMMRPEAVGLAGFMGLAAATGLLAGIDPRIAIGVALGLGFLLLAFTNLTAGLVAFVILSFLEFVLPAGSALSLLKIGGFILALAWMAKIATSRERVFFVDHPGATVIFVAFLTWGTVSINWSEGPSETLLELSRYLQMLALLVITYTATKTRNDVRWVVGAFLAGIVITALYALIDRPAVDPGLVRIEAPVGDANGVAAFLVVGLVLAAAVALQEGRSSMERAVAISALPLFMVAFVYTGSRSGIVSLATALVATVAFAGRWRPKALVAAVVAALAAMAVFVSFAPAGIKQRISETTPGQLSETEGRVTVWQVGWRMFEDQPVQGVGLGSFQATSIHYVLEPGFLAQTEEVIDRPQVAHNVYLQVLAELGLIGEILFLGLMGFPLVCALRAAGAFARRKDQQMEILSRAVAIALLGFYASNFFLPGQFNKLLWVLMGLGPVLLAVSRANDSGPGAESARAAPHAVP